ncbi:hypothetical protein FRACYDRAFT_260210 [Fragilariopsis cylindrus CCMP1102]|uniref:Upf1 domain-containing protein n=1 Tax=Fragilariopsis cylindrus CCMP1102 TaxID=635003 RepID=A0A1E7FPG9_9STRA|nr:hypothetical protein FRACYDRAFT_260210 [Fragilariopsis cylindrus CCMP1102]|eukprot:OEU20041.1 hypothetical protein FRACYDRAFT_260210 [Fragilariopsis cylindrus CCMP1102]
MTITTTTNSGSGEPNHPHTNHYDEEKLPEYSCRYCGIHDPACVAQCVESKKWFCNAVCGSGGSHLVHHLVRSRSHQVQLHPESPLGETVLECYNCTSKNVFVLGFVPASSSSVVVLLCRVCVETVPALKDMDWELAQWHPLIQDRKFLPWLIKVPSDKLMLKSRDIAQSQMAKLEELWKNEPEANFADLDRPDIIEDEEMQPTLLQYEDGFHYQNVLAPLVKIEADYDRQMKESLTEESVSVHWGKSLAGKNVATFTFHRLAVEQSRIMVGDELRLKLGDGASYLYSKPWEGIGYVKGIIDGEVELELRTAGNVPDQIHDDYVVEYIWKSTSFDRMQNALKAFAIDDTSVTGYIYHKLLGHPVEEQLIATAKIPASERDYEVPGLPSLNESQREAVATVLERPLSLIQGPPGTGKTVTSATLVFHMTKQNMGQVLVTAPSNVAVDQLTEKIAATGLRVVRLASKQERLPAGDEFMKLHRLKNEIGDLSERDQKKYRSLRNRTEREILQAADVICCTCVGAADPRLKNFRFLQYRMHPALSEFPSNMFYEGSLQNGVTEADRQLLNEPGFTGKEDFAWPVPSKPMFFYSINGMEEISASGTSYLNRTEASYVEKVVTHLLRLGVTPAQIGVITPYDEYDCLVEGPLNNLQPSYMTFARPRRNPAGDSRYAFTALARGGWDGRWDDRRGNARNAPSFRSGGRSGGRRGNGKDSQNDSRFDSRYGSYEYDGDSQAPKNGSNGLPIPNFAPLPSYTGGDDGSSVGGDSSYGGSQFGGSRASMMNGSREKEGPGLGYYVGMNSGNGNYFSDHQSKP